MKREKIYIDLVAAKRLAELLRDQEIPEETIIERLGVETDKKLHPDEKSPRKSASQIDQEMKDGGEQYVQFFFSALIRLEDGTTVDLAVTRIIVADLLAKGATEKAVREQVGEKVWHLLQPKEEKKDKKKEKKQTIAGKLFGFGKKVLKRKQTS